MSERDAELFASSQFNNPKSADVIVNVRFRAADCGRFYAHSDILREAARYFALQSDAALEMVCPTMPSLEAMTPPSDVAAAGSGDVPTLTLALSSLVSAPLRAFPVMMRCIYYPTRTPRILAQYARGDPRAVAWLLAWFCSIDDEERKCDESCSLPEKCWRATALHMRRTLAEDSVVSYLAVAMDAYEKYSHLDRDGSLAALRNDAFSFLLEAFMPISRSSADVAETARILLRKYALQVLKDGSGSE